MIRIRGGAGPENGFCLPWLEEGKAKGGIWSRPVLSGFFLVVIVSFLYVGGIFPDLKKMWRDGRSASAVFSMTDSERLAYLDSLAGLVIDDPGSLFRLVALDLAGLFGTPDLEREDIPTVMWQYRSRFCVLDLYFQIGLDGDVSASPVAYYEIRGREPGEEMHVVSGPAVSACLSAIVNAHRPAVQIAAVQ